MWACCAKGVEDAQQVDFHVCLEHTRLSANDGQLLCYPSIGHDHVEATQILHQFADGSIDLFGVSYVALAPRSAPARGRSLSQELWLQSKQCDQGALLVQVAGDCRSDAAGSAGDQDSFAEQWL